jgi:hypothetical protein
MVDITDALGSGIRRNGVAVSKVYEIGAFGITRAIRDVTALSDLDCHKHKLNLPDLPEINFKCWYDPQDSGHLAIISDSALGAQGVWQVDIQHGDSPAENIVFEAYVMSATVEGAAVDSDFTLNVTLKPQTQLVGLFENPL